ncbi:MAG: hypothetical protein KGK11_04000 [Sphingomonadales bacterium]|nr:hypothetical protein [Sphingomonadales bacterium]
MPAVARILSRFDRPALESFLAVALDLLDVLDAPGDPDEPAFAVPCSDGQPGDPCDTELAGDDADISWPEWQTRGRRKLTAGGYEMPGASSLAANEDAEDDDPDHGLDEGEPDFARYRGEGPGCPISDPGEADDGL